MDIKKYIRKIVDEGNNDEMEKLSDILVEVTELIKKYDEDKYKEYKLCLYKMAYGDEMTEETAIECVKKMKPYGIRWQIDETEKMQRERNLNDLRVPDFFYAMNQGFNDFRNVLGDNIENYVRYADNFINDEDARKDKVLAYAFLMGK